MERVNPKYSRGFIAIALSVSFMLFAMPILAQQNDLMAGRIAGEQAARANVSGGLWLVIGCFGGLIGVIVAYVYEPSPPSAQLLGKSPEYVAAYTDAYKATAKSVQTSKAITGCIVSAVVSIALNVALVAASAE